MQKRSALHSCIRFPSPNWKRLGQAKVINTPMGSRGPAKPAQVDSSARHFTAFARNFSSNRTRSNLYSYNPMSMEEPAELPAFLFPSKRKEGSISLRRHLPSFFLWAGDFSFAFCVSAMQDFQLPAQDKALFGTHLEDIET